MDSSGWGARAAFLGGALSVAMGVLVLVNPQYWRYETAPDYLAVALEGAALLAILGGLIGVYAFHKAERGGYGRLGWSGYSAAFAGIPMAGAGHLAGVPFFEFAGTGGMVYVLIGLSQGIVLAWGMVYILGTVFMSLGLLLAGVANIRAGALPAWCGVALILGPVGLWTLGNALGWILFGLTWIAVGYALLRAKRTGRAARVA